MCFTQVAMKSSRLSDFKLSDGDYWNKWDKSSANRLFFESAYKSGEPNSSQRGFST